MKLIDTKANKKHSIVKLMDGVYLQTMSMTDMHKRFEDIDKELEGKPQETIDKMFDDLIRDENGDKFEDLVKNKASEVLPLETIKAIINAIPGAITPSPK